VKILKSRDTARPERAGKPRRKDGRAGRKARQAARPARPARTLMAFRRTAVTGITVAIFAMTIDAFAESYRGLYEWFSGHGISGFWAGTGPLMVDGFILVGELVLIIALADQWPWHDRLMAWAAVLLGLAASVGGNIGHVNSADWTVRGTAAIPPLAASGALALGLAVLKRMAVDPAVPDMPAYAATMTVAAPVAAQEPQAPPVPEQAPVPALEAPASPSSPAAPAHGLDPAHLAGLDSAAKRARYAGQVLGTDSPAAVAAALTAAGYPTDRQAARSGLRDRRPDASVTPLRKEAAGR
jgi:hypothetical protein